MAEWADLRVESCQVGDGSVHEFTVHLSVPAAALWTPLLVFLQKSIRIIESIEY